VGSWTRFETDTSTKQSNLLAVVIIIIIIIIIIIRVAFEVKILGDLLNFTPLHGTGIYNNSNSD
jgi:heme/copper-type cytochrome/quinol oxidase subunit 2